MFMIKVTGGWHNCRAILPVTAALPATTAFGR